MHPQPRRSFFIPGLLLVLAAALGGGIGGWFTGKRLYSRPAAVEPPPEPEVPLPAPVVGSPEPEIGPREPAPLLPGPHPPAGPRPAGVSVQARVRQLAWDAEQDGTAGYVGVYLAPTQNPHRPLAEYRGNEDFPSASTIKVPVMLAVVDAWKGDRMPRTRQFEALLEEMIQESSNTATNELVDGLGGLDVLNADLRRRLKTEEQITVMASRFRAGARGRPQNRACPRELAQLLAEISRREEKGGRHGREMMEYMRRTMPGHRTRIPAGIPEPYRARVANKTGTLAHVVNDVAVLEAPGGRRYVLCLFMEKVPDIPAAESFSRRLSALCWEALQMEPGVPAIGEGR